MSPGWCFSCPRCAERWKLMRSASHHFQLPPRFWHAFCVTFWTARACSPGEQLLTRTRIAWMLWPQHVCGCHLEFRLDHGTLPRPLLELLRRPSKTGTRKQHLRHPGRSQKRVDRDEFSKPKFWCARLSRSIKMMFLKAVFFQQRQGCSMASEAFGFGL